MDFRAYQKRIEYLLELVRKKRLLSVGAVAQRFGCSTRTIKRMLNHLRDQGHNICYDRQQKKYVIKEDE